MEEVLKIILFFSIALNTNRIVIEQSSTQIKLCNLDTISVDISGWQVYGDEGLSYTFPQGTVIPPSGHIVVPIKAQKSSKLTVLNLVNKKAKSNRETSKSNKPPAPQLKSSSPKHSFIHRLYSWLDPTIETESNFTHPNAKVKAVGGTANQRIIGPLSIGIGGKYVKKEDTLQTYMGLGNIKLNFNKLGSFRIHHQQCIKGKEVPEHPSKTIFSWTLPTICGLNLSLNNEHKWNEEFKANFYSIRVERAIGSNFKFYTIRSVQNLRNNIQNCQQGVGVKGELRINKFKLYSLVEVWKDVKRLRVYDKFFNPSIEYFSSELFNFSIKMPTHLWLHEHNHVLQIKGIVPIKFGLHLGIKGELNYHIPKEWENWYSLKRRVGVVYIPHYTHKFKLISSIKEEKNPWNPLSYQVSKSYKIIAYPVKMIRTSLKYTYTETKKLASLWVKYINDFFELGVGNRVFWDEEGMKYGLSIGGGIRKFRKFSFVCGYRGGFNLIGIPEEMIVNEYYREKGYYIKFTTSENSFENLFEDE